MFGMVEWILIAVILLFIFGARRMPGIGEGIGRGLRNFVDSVKDKPEHKAAGAEPERE